MHGGDLYWGRGLIFRGGGLIDGGLRIRFSHIVYRNTDLVHNAF